MALFYENVGRLREVIFEAFTVKDIAEPLLSFDYDASAEDVAKNLVQTGSRVAGVRKGGKVIGYVRHADLLSGRCGERMHTFQAEDIVPDSAALLTCIQALERRDCCFVSVLGEVGGVVVLQDLEKPPIRMFLFGLLSLMEVLVMREIQRSYPGDSWHELLSPGRMEKARLFQQERTARRMPADLLSCLQFSDKLEILTRNPDTLRSLGQPSRKSALQAIKELENLRNNLAHSQNIVTPEWQRIVIFSSNMHRVLERMEELSHGDAQRLSAVS